MPDAIIQVVGKFLNFGVYVQKEHIVYGPEIYMVGKVFKERNECLTDEVTQTESFLEKGLTFTSGEEVISTSFTFTNEMLKQCSVYFCNVSECFTFTDD